MGCDCDNGLGVQVYGSVCTEDKPYPIVSAESVPSLISNLTYALYGTITKSVVNGGIVWNIPCDPNLTAQITGLPRNTGEGLLCYFIRCFNLILSGSFVIQPGSIAPSQLTTGHPTWDGSSNLTVGGNLSVGGNLAITGTITGTITNATNATNAQCLQGGAAGSIPYQLSSNVTNFLAGTTAQSVLASGGLGAPSWKPISNNGTGNGNSVAVFGSDGSLTASAFNGKSTSTIAWDTPQPISLTGAVTGTMASVNGTNPIVIPTTLTPGAAGTVQAMIIFDATPAAITQTGGTMSFSGPLATFTPNTPWAGMATGDFITIWGSSQGAFNVTGAAITTNGAGGFTFNMSATPTGPIGSFSMQPYHVLRNFNVTSVAQATSGSNGLYNVYSPAFSNGATLPPVILTNAAGTGKGANGASGVGWLTKIATAPTGAGSPVHIEFWNAANTVSFDFPYTQIIVF